MKTYEVTLVVEVNADSSTAAARKVLGYPGQDVKTICVSTVEVEEEDTEQVRTQDT